MNLYMITNKQSYEDNDTEFIIADNDTEAIIFFIEHKNRFKYDVWSMVQDSFHNGMFLLLRTSIQENELYWIHDRGEVLKGVIQ